MSIVELIIQNMMLHEGLTEREAGMLIQAYAHGRKCSLEEAAEEVYDLVVDGHIDLNGDVYRYENIDWKDLW